MRRVYRAIAALAAVAALAVVPTAGRAAATITYGIVDWNPFHWVLMVGLARGQFDKHGVKLEVTLTGSAGAGVQALAGGSLNMTTTTPAAAFPLQAKTPDLKQIIGVYERSPYSLVVNPDVKKVDDLRGK